MKRCARILTPALLVLPFACTHVETGQPQIVPAKDGQPTAEADTVEAMVKPKLAEFNSCYKDEQSRNPKASGKVLFAFTVMKDGRTSEVRLLASTLKSPVMEGCLVGKIEGWQFAPPRDGQEIKVRYPFAFQP